MKLWQTIGGTPRRRDVTIVVTLLVLSLFALYLVMGGARSGKLHIVSGLDEAVIVQVGNRNVVVEPQSQSVLVLPNGAYLATTKTRAGKLVETAIVVSDSHPDAVVYNVLGSAPLLDAHLRYTSGPASEDRTGDVNFHGGKRLAVVDDLDYVFVEPPKSISAKQSSGAIVKRALMMPKGGAAATATFLLRAGRGADAVELQRGLLRVDATSVKALNYASQASYVAYGGDEPIVSMLAPAVRNMPVADDDIPARYMISEGCRYDCDSVMEIVRASGDQETVTRKLTMLRGQGEADMRRELAALAVTHADDASVARARGWLALLDGNWSECVALFERVSRLPHADFDVEEHAFCLQAAGRHADALAVAARVASSGGEAAWNGAITYARIAAVGGEAPGTYIDKLDEDPASRAAMRAVWLGLFDRKAPKPRDDSSMTDALDVVLALSQSAEAGMELVKKKPAAVRHVPDVVTLVLGGELARRGDLVAAGRVLDSAPGVRLPSSAVIDYVLRGTVHRMLYRIAPEHRAALDFVRARRLEQLGLDSQLLYASARKRDFLQGWVHRLMESWAAPERQNDVLVYTSTAE